MTIDPGVYIGDNLEVMGNLTVGQFILAYLDPPFFTQRNFQQFNDKWTNMQSYLDYLRPRIAKAWELLDEGGSLVIHLDHHASHHVKVMVDALVGIDRFASEIVWRYRRWPSKQENFQHVHDVLLRWVKGLPTWNQLYEPLSEGTVKRHGATRQNKQNRATPRWNQLYEPPSPSTLATWGTKKQRAVFKGGNRLKSEATEEESPGVPLGDVWDISIVAPNCKERLNYPTQKPEALLERLVYALTNEGDFVLDPFCGCGTVAAVCYKFGRKCVSIDSNTVAIEKTETGLRGLQEKDLMLHLKFKNLETSDTLTGGALTFCDPPKGEDGGST